MSKVVVLQILNFSGVKDGLVGPPLADGSIAVEAMPWLISGFNSSVDRRGVAPVTGSATPQKG